MSILNNTQKLFLDLFSKNKFLSELFYFTGGTALAEYYISYRYSEDLDFFGEEEFDEAKLKFDWSIDPIKLGSQFLLSTELKDYPKLFENISEKEWQNFFIEEAKKLKGLILS